MYLEIFEIFIRQVAQVKTSKVFQTYVNEIYAWCIVWYYLVRTHPGEVIMFLKSDFQIFSNFNRWNVFIHHERNLSNLHACTKQYIIDWTERKTSWHKEFFWMSSYISIWVKSSLWIFFYLIVCVSETFWVM